MNILASNLDFMEQCDLPLQERVQIVLVQVCRRVWRGGSGP